MDNHQPATKSVQISAARFENPLPDAYRLVRYRTKDGETHLKLQGYFTWTQGWNQRGGKWRDIETVDADDLEALEARAVPYGGTDEQVRRARAAEAGKAAADAGSDAVLSAPEPSSSLVERVAKIDGLIGKDRGYARAAIREVAAAALQMHPDKNLTWERVALWLEQEAER